LFTSLDTKGGVRWSVLWCIVVKTHFYAVSFVFAIRYSRNGAVTVAVEAKYFIDNVSLSMKLLPLSNLEGSD